MNNPRPASQYYEKQNDTRKYQKNIAELKPTRVVAGDSVRDQSVVPNKGIDPEQLLDQPQLEALLQRLLDRARSEPVRATLALLQLKNFYEIRTWVGKAEASLLLADISLVLCKALPPTVTLSRCNNYEFALLLSNECSSNAHEITRRVQSALKNAASTTIPPQLQLQCAVGLARIEAGVLSAEVLFARARHTLCHTEDRTSELDSKSLARLITRALRSQQLELNFQPLLRFKREDRQCYEVRSSIMDTSVAGTEHRVSGQRLFEIAVWNALGEALDRAVILRCKAAIARPALCNAQLVVNLSLNSLVSARFQQWLANCLAQNPQLKQQLLLQISELDLLVAQHHLTTFSEAMRTMGLPLCITHFGSTREPMRYMHLLHVYMVKLDASLLSRLKEESLQLATVQQLIDQLHDKGIRVSAGMIERAAQLPLFWQIGIDAVQGDSIVACSPEPRYPSVEQIELSASELTN